MKVEVFEATTYFDDAALFIINKLQSYKGRTVTFALCGGSTPKPIYELLGKAVKADPSLSDIMFELYLGDERFVPLADDRSNYKMVIDSGFADISGRSKLYPLDVESQSVEEASIKYENLLETNVSKFDFMLLGIGDDGHTASLFPNDIKALHEKTKKCIAVSHPTDGTTRMSMTFPVLEAATHIFFLARGAGKAKLLKEVVKGDFTIENYPSTFWKRCEDKVSFLFDKPAAALLG